MGLEAAVKTTAKFLNKTVKPILVARSKLAKACEGFIELADKSSYPYSAMPSTKGLTHEDHKHFVEIFWGAMRATLYVPIIESVDAYTYLMGLSSMIIVLLVT
jgi:pyruvate decarboxylase